MLQSNKDGPQEHLFVFLVVKFARTSRVGRTPHIPGRCSSMNVPQSVRLMHLIPSTHYLNNMYKL